MRLDLGPFYTECRAELTRIMEFCQISECLETKNEPRIMEITRIKAKSRFLGVSVDLVITIRCTVSWVMRHIMFYNYGIKANFSSHMRDRECTCTST